MSLLPERVDPYRATKVSLAPVSDEQQTDENLEPPFVRVRTGNESFVFADSEIRDAPSDLFNVDDFTLGGGNHQFYVRKIKRLSIDGIQFALCTPNVNIRNNTITFFSTTSGTNHTVVVPEGLYPSAPALATALQTALNTATGASGLTWTITVNPINACQYTLSVAGGTYHFILSSPMIMFGRYLYNLPQDQANTASKTMGGVFGLYSRYVDIISNALTEYTKNPSSSNARGPNGLVARVFIASPLTPGVGGITSGAVDFFASAASVGYNYDRSRALETIDVGLRDEFGQPFYIPSLSTGSPPNSALTLIIKTEL